MTLSLPAPEPERARGAQADPEQSSHREKPIPTINQILQQLQTLNSRVLLKIISTAQAGVIHRNLQTILNVQLKQTQSGPSAMPREDLVELCRQNPSAMPALEPFLTDEQLRWLMEQVTESPHAKT